MFSSSENKLVRGILMTFFFLYFFFKFQVNVHLKTYTDRNFFPMY